jgi:hypothetical protein
LRRIHRRVPDPLSLGCNTSKKTANIDTGTRHATKTGLKLRADPFNYGNWVVALFEAVNAAREKLEPGFKRMVEQSVGEAVARAAPYVPFE